MSTSEAENQPGKPDPNAHDVQDASDRRDQEQQAEDPTAPDRGFGDQGEYIDAETPEAPSDEAH